ncbi:MAG: hypothetical protein ACXVCY_09260 [Pseudobdellovibrionaceae bacterium]
MKKIFGFLVLLVTSSALATPASYPLKCRGTNSSEMMFEFSPTTAQVVFKKAPYAAPRGLAPGECAWMDRALNADEPSAIVQNPVAPKNMFGTTTLRYGHGPAGGNIVAPLIGIRDPEIGWLKDLLSDKNYWLFQVYNDGSGHLIVTSSQVSTP